MANCHGSCNTNRLSDAAQLFGYGLYYGLVVVVMQAFSGTGFEQRTLASRQVQKTVNNNRPWPTTPVRSVKDDVSIETDAIEEDKGQEFGCYTPELVLS